MIRVRFSESDANNMLWRRDPVKLDRDHDAMDYRKLSDKALVELFLRETEEFSGPAIRGLVEGVTEHDVSRWRRDEFKRLSGDKRQALESYLREAEDEEERSRNYAQAKGRVDQIRKFFDEHPDWTDDDFAAYLEVELDDLKEWRSKLADWTRDPLGVNWGLGEPAAFLHQLITFGMRGPPSERASRRSGAPQTEPAPSADLRRWIDDVNAISMSEGAKIMKIDAIAAAIRADMARADAEASKLRAVALQAAEGAADARARTVQQAEESATARARAVQRPEPGFVFSELTPEEEHALAIYRREQARYAEEPDPPPTPPPATPPVDRRPRATG